MNGINWWLVLFCVVVTSPIIAIFIRLLIFGYDQEGEENMDLKENPMMWNINKAKEHLNAAMMLWQATPNGNKAPTKIMKALEELDEIKEDKEGVGTYS